MAKKVGDMILCNNANNTDDEWFEHIIQGADKLSQWDENAPGEYEPLEIYQTYIITDEGASELYNHTQEIIGYNTTLDVFVWYITHFGTPWDGVELKYNEKAKHIYPSELVKLI